MNKRLAHAFPALVTLVLGGCCLAVTLMTLYVLLLSHWHGPFRDMWEIHPFLEKVVQHSWAWSDLWESYGYAHRLLIPRLLFIADYQFADASNHLLIAVSLLCQAAICFLFARILFAQHSLALWQRGCLFLLVVIFQFSGTLLFNLMHTFDVQWFLCCFLVTAAFYLLTVQKETHNVALLAVSGLLIMLACLCNFSAMAAWPIWIFFVCIRSVPVLYRGLLLAAAVVFIAVCATGVKSAGAAALGSVNILAAATYFLLQFPLLYLGNPVSDPDYLPFGPWAIILLLPSFFFLARFVWKCLRGKTGDVDRSTLFLASLMLFGLGVAVMTGLGRGYDPSHVQAFRYQNIVMLFWSSAISFLFIETRHMALVVRALLRASGVLFVVGLLACQWQSWNENLLLGRNVSRSHLALMMGYSDDVPMISATVSRSMIYVPGYNLEKERLLHAQARKGIYAGKVAKDWLEGVQRSGISILCEGVEWKLVDRRTPYTHFVEFMVMGEIASYDYALLVDESNTVVAVAEPEKEVELKELIHRKWSPSPVLLRGYSRVMDTQNLSLVMVSSRGKCSNPLKP